ncbi:MAG: putative cytokinetic ring protein SteA [Nocardioidaceae bacterium]
MKLPVLRKSRAADEPGVYGVARLDRRTKNLTKRLRPGDIAVIDHVDIDRVSAEALVACEVAAVVNVSTSVSGRYPNLGPEIIAAAGIPLIDNVGPDIFKNLDEGQRIRIDDGTIYRGQSVIAKGAVLDAERITQLMVDARAGLSTQLEAFTANTMEYLKRERALLLDGVGVPEIHTSVERRHVLIVVRGYDYREDLAALRHYVREYRPILVGVDGGADALVEAGYTPDLIIGDMDSVSDTTLQCGAELIVHAYRDGRAPGLDRLERLGLEGVVFPATGTSEDIAMLLADCKGASLIVAVGTHATLVEFLDKGRAGMASTFLTRLRVGPKLVDAKGVGRLYHHRVRTWHLLLFLVSGILALLVAIAASPTGREWLDVFDARWDDFVYWLQGLF